MISADLVGHGHGSARSWSGSRARVSHHPTPPNLPQSPHILRACRALTPATPTHAIGTTTRPPARRSTLKGKAQPARVRDPFTPKPLWRIGRATWPLLPVALALAVIAITGYDLQTRLLQGTYALLDIKAVYFLVSRVITPSGLAFGHWPPVPMFTVLGAWCVLVGAAAHPRRFRVWRDLLMLFAGLATPTLWITLHGVVFHSFPINYRLPSDPMVQALGALVSQTSIALLGALAAALLFRARLVPLVIVAAGLLGAWITIEYDWSIAGGSLLLPKSVAWRLFDWIGWLFNPAILAASLWWAIAARRDWKPPWACQSCGYDLRDSAADLCPECGTSITPRATAGAA